MARQYKLTKNNMPEGADYVSVSPVGMNGVGRVVLLKAEKSGWIAVDVDDWTSKGSRDGSVSGDGKTTDAAIVSLVDRVADRDGSETDPEESGTEAADGRDGIPGDVSESTPGNTDRVGAALAAAREKVAAQEAAAAEGDESAPEPVKAGRTRKAAVRENSALAVKAANPALNGDEKAAAVRRVVEAAKSPEVRKTERDAAIQRERERLAARKQQRDEKAREAASLRPAPVGKDVTQYAAQKIMNAFRQSAAQCSGVGVSQLSWRDAADRIQSLMGEVEDAARQSGDVRLSYMADDATAVMGRHLGLIMRDPDGCMDVMEAKRAKNRVKRAASRFGVAL